MAECSTSCTGSMRRARSSRFDEASKTRMSQPNADRYRRVERASHSATGSGRAIARFFGNSSPSTICRPVASTSAATVPMPTPTACGTETPPSAVPTAWPISGSAT